MLEDELRSILNSLSHLAAQGDIPLQAYATLVKSAKTELLVEHLHQRWLSDGNFGHIAAQMMAYIQRENPNEIKLCSQILSLSMDDYRKRYEMRRKDKLMFRNFTKSLVELMPVFFKIDKFMGSSLVKPLFDCMFMLLEGNTEEEDIMCVGHVLVRSGHLLDDLDQHLCDKMVMKTRLALCSTEPPLGDQTRFTLLNAIDLWTYKWNMYAMPPCLSNFYNEQYEHYQMLKEYEERRWLPPGFNRYDSSSLEPPSILSSYSTLTPQEPESTV